jgi:hypothetical protein
VKPLNYHDLLDAFAETGCPVCRLLKADGDRFLDLLFHENIMDVGVQQSVRAARLLCSTHAWQMITFRGRAQDIAVLCEAVLDELIARVDTSTQIVPGLRLPFAQPRSNGAADALEPTQPCMCCAHIDRMEKNYIQTIATYFGEPDMQEAYRVSEGLCLPHFRLLLRALRDPMLVKTAIEVQIHLWQLLKDELTLFLHRTSPNNVDEPFGAEADSWRRAIMQLAGDEVVFGLRRGEDKS